MRKMTENQIRQAISNVNATLAVEGLKPSRRVTAYGRKFFRDEMTIDQAIQLTTKKILEKNDRLGKL